MSIVRGFPSGSALKNSPVMQETQQMQVRSWVGKIPRRRAWQPTPVFFLENPMDRGAWKPTVLGVAKSRTRLEQLNMLTGTSVIKGALDGGLCMFPQCNVQTLL